MTTIHLATEEELQTLQSAVEVYIRLCLGQVAEIANRLKILLRNREPSKLQLVCHQLQKCETILFLEDERPFKLDDKETPIEAIVAFGILAMLQDDSEGREWAKAVLKKRRH